MGLTWGEIKIDTTTPPGGWRFWFLLRRAPLKKGKQTIKLFGGNSYQTNPGIQKLGPKGEDIPM